MTLSPLHAIPVRLSLVADAVICGALAALALAAAGPLADAMDLPVTLIRGAGIVLLPYIAYLAFIVSRNLLTTATIRVAVLVNILWAVGCAVVLLSGQVEPNALGVAFILVQAAGVLVIGAVQHLGAREASLA